jgi:hypothetical protein
MKTKKFLLFKIFALFGLSLFLLASCGAPKETPEEVIQNFKSQVTEISSGDISAEIVMNSTDDQDVIDLTAEFDFKFDFRDQEDKKTDIKVSMSGMMKTSEQDLDGDIDFNIRTIGEKYYILLDKLESSSEGMASIQSIVGDYIGKWLHIADDFIPKNVPQLQEKDEKALAIRQQKKQLFVDTDLFTVTQEYGVESVNGEKTYHYGIQFNESGVQEYIRKAAIIDGRDLTEAEIEEASKVISYVDNVELWIGVNDYYPYKATIYLTGGSDEDDAVDVNIMIAFKGSGYNRSIKISKPTGVEEFNPMELLMAYSTASMDIGEAVDASVPSDIAEPGTEDMIKALEDFEALQGQ